MFTMIAVRGGGQPAAKFTELQRFDNTGTGREGVLMAIEIPPGAASVRHSHPGEDFGYLVSGTLLLQIDGKPPVTVKAGEAFFTERDHVHSARNIGTTTARTVEPTSLTKGHRSSRRLNEADLGARIPDVPFFVA